MATELASGFVSLSVRYSSAMRQINQDFNGLERTAQRAGTDAGNALSTSLSRASRLDANDARRALSPMEQAARRSGSDAGQELGQSIVQNARREVQSNGSAVTEGLAQGASEAGSSAGSGFMAALGPKIAELGTKAGPIGAALAAAVGLAAVAGGLLAKEVTAGFERDMANRKLQVQLGIDQTQMAGVNEAINNAYKNNFGESVDTLRESAAAVIKNGLASATGDPAVLQKVIEQIDTVAQVTGATNDEIARSAAVLTKSGVATDTANALDLITKAAQSGLDVSGDLMDTFTEYGVQFKKIGIDGQQALGLIKQLMDGGARSTDLAADALKEFSIRSIDGSKSTVEAYTAIGVNADEMAAKLAAGGPAATQAFGTIVSKIAAIQDPVQRSAIQVQLFGTQAEDLGDALNHLDPANAVAAIGQVDGAVQNASDTLGGGATSGFESFGRSLEVLRGKFQDFLAKAFGPMAKQFGDWLTNALPKLQEFFEQKIGPAIQSIMPALQEFWNGLKEGGSILGGQWMDNVKSLWPEVQKLGSAMKEAFTAALPVIKGVATAVGALILVWMKIQGTVMPLVVKAFTLLYDAISAIYNTVVPAVTAGFNAIGTVATWLWQNAIQPAWQGISTAISTAWSVITTIFDAIKTAVSAVGSAFQFAFNDFILPMWNNLQTVVSAAWSVISPIWDGIKTGISAIGEVFQGVFSSAISPVWEGIKSAFSEGWNFLSGIFESMKGGFQAVADFIKGVWSGISGGVKSALDAVVNALRGPLHTIGGLLAGIPDNVFGLDLPGVQTAHALGAKLQAFALGGTVRGQGGTDNVLAWLTAGEGVVTKQAMANGGATLVAALNNGWVPPVEMIRSMIGSVPGFAEGLNPGADFLRTQIMQLWPQITSVGGKRADRLPEHPTGNAIDVMIPKWDTPEGAALGNQVLAFLQKNASALQVDGIIWRQVQYGYGSSLTSGKPYGDHGDPNQNHFTHLHVILGKGRGAGAAPVNVPSVPLSLPSGGSVSASSASFSPGSASGGGASAQQLQNAQDKVTDLQARLDTSQMALDEAKAKGTDGSALKAKQDAVDKNQRELEQAKADLETLKQQGPTTGKSGSTSDNPFSQILSGFGQLADLAKGGLIESLLPPGFNNPLEGSLFKSGAGILNFAASITQDPTAKGILGIASQAMGGSASGVVQGIGALIPQPFGDFQIGSPSLQPGDAQPHPGSGALPGPANLASAFMPDPQGNGGGGVVNNDNSVHVAEGGQINENATQILDKTRQQQVAAQNPQLGTRRFI
jgi:phage-related minor tail protein